MSGKDIGRAAERLLDLLGQLPDDVLEEAVRTDNRQEFEGLDLSDPIGEAAENPSGEGEEGRAVKRPLPLRRLVRQGWKRYGAYAACLCLVLISLTLWRLSPDGEDGHVIPAPAEGAGEQGGGMAGGGKEEGANSVEDGRPVTTAACMPEDTQAGDAGAAGNISGGTETTAAAIETQEAPLVDGLEPGSIDKEQRESGFWYGGRRYAAARETVVFALPDGYKPVEVLRQADGTAGADGTTWDEELVGCLIYAKASGDVGDEEIETGVLYVEREDGYYVYRPE